MCKFLRCKLKRKVIWETFLVAFYRLNQNFCRDLIKFCQMTVEHHLLTANQENKVLNPFQRNQVSSFIHII